MADYKYPNKSSAGRAALTSNITFSFPEGRMDDGYSKAFEVKLLNVTSLDTNVSFKIYSGLDEDVLSMDNIQEAVASINLAGVTGNLVFKRNILNTLDTNFKITISGTNVSSTASFLIRARSA